MLAEECDGRVPDLAMIGFRALVNTLSSESYKTEEVITSFQPEDFATDAANEKYAELAMQIGQVRQRVVEWTIVRLRDHPRCGSIVQTISLKYQSESDLYKNITSAHRAPTSR